MSANLGGQPIFILKEGSQRTRGRDAQSGNIAAAKAVASAVRTTLGPKGMDKMLVDTIGDVVITNDGVTILKEMDIEHPAAKMMVEIAKTQDDEVGDGTTTATLLAQAIVREGLKNVVAGANPIILKKGIEKAVDVAVEEIKKAAKPVESKEDIAKVASISASDAQIGNLIAERSSPAVKAALQSLLEAR